MARDQLVRAALERTNWDLLACSAPANVLLLSGYWPGAGYSLAVASRDGQIVLIVPEDEDDIAERSWADEVSTYSPAPLDRLMSLDDCVYEALSNVKRATGLSADRIGFEQTDGSDPWAYAPQLHRGAGVRLLRRAFPSATLAPADELLSQLRTVKTPAEIEHIRTACRIAEQALTSVRSMLAAGYTEAQAAAAGRLPLGSCLGNFGHLGRCDGFVYCMSGANSARGFGPYSRSRSRTIEADDLVILRCHAYADGYWADVARTYHVGGAVTGDTRRMFDAVLGARQAMLAEIRPGARAADLDRTARAVLDSYGFCERCKHPTGHGAGFDAADHTARPRLHPRSEDVLETGMVIKLEPGLYLDAGGVRNADIVAVGDGGPEILSSFHWELADLAVN